MTGNRKIDDLLNQVMDSQGNMKACGRTTCQKLLTVLQEFYPDECFGDLRSGFLNSSLIYERFVKQND